MHWNRGSASWKSASPPPAMMERVHDADALFSAKGVQLFRQGGGGGGHINGKSSLFGVVKDAALPRKDLFHVLGIADHDKDKIRVRYSLFDGVAGSNAELLLQGEELFIAAGVGGHRIARLGQVPGLLAAHDAGSDPCDFFHVSFFLSFGYAV